MNSRERSLHALVDKWIGDVSIRVTHRGRTGANGQRYAHVEVMGLRRTLGIYFFRHTDGSWGVYPSNRWRVEHA
jgi:hypothetical protein